MLITSNSDFLKFKDSLTVHEYFNKQKILPTSKIEYDHCFFPSSRMTNMNMESSFVARYHTNVICLFLLEKIISRPNEFYLVL
jgi:hypothetical protein